MWGACFSPHAEQHSTDFPDESATNRRFFILLFFDLPSEEI